MARQPDVTLPLRHCKMARPVDKLSGKHNLPIWRERMGRERKNEIKQRAEQNLLFVRRFPVPTSTIYPTQIPVIYPTPDITTKTVLLFSAHSLATLRPIDL